MTQTDTQRPNGLAFSPDEKILYVADMSVIDFPTQGRRHIRAYGISDTDAVKGHSIAKIEPGIPDGFAVDGKGGLFVSFEYGIKSCWQRENASVNSSYQNGFQIARLEMHSCLLRPQVPCIVLKRGIF